jgi:hypothetical protein
MVIAGLVLALRLWPWQSAADGGAGSNATRWVRVPEATAHLTAANRAPVANLKACTSMTQVNARKRSDGQVIARRIHEVIEGSDDCKEFFECILAGHVNCKSRAPEFGLLMHLLRGRPARPPIQFRMSHLVAQSVCLSESFACPQRHLPLTPTEYGQRCARAVVLRSR